MVDVLSALGALTMIHWTLRFWASATFMVWKVLSYWQVPQLVATAIHNMRNVVGLADATSDVARDLRDIHVAGDFEAACISLGVVAMPLFLCCARSGEGATRKRAMVAVWTFLACDAPDIQYAAKEAAR